MFVNHRLRPYQKKAVDSIKSTNAIVKMPTGSGKTFIAAELIRRSLTPQTTSSSTVNNAQSCPNKALFLVPTRDLVEQQSHAVTDWCGTNVEVQGVTGGKTPSTHFDVLVSTPQVFVNLQSRDERFNWKMFRICIFDEVHHVLKHHPYRVIALSLKQWNSRQSNSKIQIVGLSASLTYAVQDNQVEAALRRLSYELSVEKMYSPTNDELIEGGYVPQEDNIEVVHSRKYIPDNVVPEHERKPHLMHAIFMQRIKGNTATPFSTKIFNVVKRLENEARKSFLSFRSPLDKPKLISWEEYAHKCRPHCSNSDIFNILEVWYVALRMIVQSWEEEEQLVLKWLQTTGVLQKKDEHFGTPLIEGIHEILEMSMSEINCTRLGMLREQLQIKKARFGSNFRAIIFVQQRITAHVVSSFINNDVEMQHLDIKSGYIASRGSQITPSIKVTPSMAKENIVRFRNGNQNVIVATSVIEEGFDVPAANVVISFDHMKDSVELCQRFGRARQENSSTVVMDERRDRSIAKLQQVKRRQDGIVQEFDPSNVNHNKENDMIAQKSREKNAASLLLNEARCSNTPTAVLNTYVAKTKAILENKCRGKNGKFQHEMMYKSATRSFSATGVENTKKQSKSTCALILLRQLRDMT